MTQAMKLAKATIGLALAASMTACASYRPPFPIPDEPGFYALSRSNELQRIDGDKAWEVKTWAERSSLSPATQFVILDSSLANELEPQARIALWRVAWVRSEVGANNLAMPVSGNSWAVAPIASQRVPISIERAPRTPEAVHIVPTALKPGLYALQLSGNGIVREARLGVQWGAVDKRQYSAVNCVDRYTAQGSAYKSCTGQTAANQSESAQPISAEGLEITLVDPLRDGNHLIVQGVVTNTTDQTKIVPPIQVVLRSKAGQELTRDVIRPQNVELGPGKRMTFKTEILHPMGPAKVRVTFVSDSTAGIQ